MNYSSSSHISPSGISSDLYPQDLQSLHIHSSQGLAYSIAPICGLCRQLGFLLISFHQLQSIRTSHWWTGGASGLSSHSLFPGQRRSKLEIRNRNITIGFPIQTTNIFFTMNFNTEIDFFRWDHDNHHQQFYRRDKPPRQEQTYISYLMFLI